MSNASGRSRVFGPSPALPHDELVGVLATPRLLAHGHLAPLGLRLAANRGFAFATAMRMVARVHSRAAHRRTYAHVARATGLANRDGGVLGVANLAERGHAFDEHAAHFTRRQAYLCPVAFLGHELRTHASAAHHLTAS